MNFKNYSPMVSHNSSTNCYQEQHETTYITESLLYIFNLTVTLLVVHLYFLPFPFAFQVDSK